MNEQDRLAMEQDNAPDEKVQSEPSCITCGADVSISDPNGAICKLCQKFEHSCTCNPNGVVDLPMPLIN